MTTGKPCPDCHGAGVKQYRWGNFMAEKICQWCVGTGVRGRHRK